MTPSCLIDLGQGEKALYIGWNPGSTVRMHLFGGWPLVEMVVSHLNVGPELLFSSEIVPTHI